MNKARSLLAVLTILGASGLGAAWLVSAREEPQKRNRVNRGVAVETIAVTRAAHRLDVRAPGIVIPARDLDVFPQVSGRIEWLHEGLVPGTFVSKGQPLFRIEARDYHLAIQRAEAELQRAQSALDLEKGQQRIARREWQVLGSELSGDEDGEIDPQALVLRRPQLQAAEGAVAVAQANLAQAKLDAARTTFATPFDSVVIESNAEIGQLASPQTMLARLVGTEKFWVQVSLPAKQIAAIAIPGVDQGQGADVIVEQHVGERVVKRTGHVLRLLSNLEPSSRMARLLVEIDDPYGVESAKGREERPYPILLDMYIDVIIRGKEERQLVKVARGAVREGNVVYVATDEGKLDIRELQIAWQEPDGILVESGLNDGERVITTPLAGAVEGMKLRDVTEAVATADSDGDDPPDG